MACSGTVSLFIMRIIDQITTLIVSEQTAKSVNVKVRYTQVTMGSVGLRRDEELRLLTLQQCSRLTAVKSEAILPFHLPHLATTA
jgi:hypothetical protein